MSTFPHTFTHTNAVSQVVNYIVYKSVNKVYTLNIVNNRELTYSTRTSRTYMFSTTRRILLPEFRVSGYMQFTQKQKKIGCHSLALLSERATLLGYIVLATARKITELN